MTAFELVTANLWAIVPDFLTAIVQVSAREEVTPEAVRARLGEPLKFARVTSKRDGVATLPITGPIFRRANMFTEISGATSIGVLATDLQAAIDDPEIAAIVLEIDSPGGTVAGVSEFAEMVRASPKPVHAHIDGYGASAAYWIAAAADSITLAATAMVGSIGVVSTHVKKDEKSRTVEIVSSQSPNKRLDVANDADRAKIQAEVDALGEVFVRAVAEMRGVSPETVLKDFGAGGCLVGAAAVAAGMADRMGTYESLIADLASGRGVPGRPTKTKKKGPAMPPENQAAQATEPPAMTLAEATALRERLAALEASEARYKADKFNAQLAGVARESGEFVAAAVKAGTLLPAARPAALAAHAQAALDDAGITSHVARIEGVGAEAKLTIAEAAQAGVAVSRAKLFSDFVAASPRHGLFAETLPVRVESNDAAAGDPNYQSTYEATKAAEERLKARSRPASRP